MKKKEFLFIARNELTFACALFLITAHIVLFKGTGWSFLILNSWYFASTFFALLFIRNRYDLASPLFLFLVFCFVGIWFRFIVCSFYGYPMWFEKDGRLAWFFQKTPKDLLATLTLFLTGYTTFIIGYVFIWRDRPLHVVRAKIAAIPKESYLVVLFVAMVLVFILVVYFNLVLQIGLPSTEVQKLFFENFVGLARLASFYALFFLLSLFFICSQTANKSSYLVVSFLSLLGYAIYLSVLGWKKGFVIAIWIVLVGFLFAKIRTRKLVLTFILVLAITFLFFYPVVQYYRATSKPGIVLETHGIRGAFSDFIETFSLRRAEITEDKSNLFDRVSCFDFLYIIRRYMKGEDKFSFVKNPNAPTLLTRVVLGFGDSAIFSFDPSMWGMLYMYWGGLGVAIGMTIFGILSRIVFSVLRNNLIGGDASWLSFYTVFMWWYAFVLRTGISILALKDLVCLLGGCLFLIYILRVFSNKIYSRIENR